MIFDRRQNTESTEGVRCSRCLGLSSRDGETPRAPRRPSVLSVLLVGSTIRSAGYLAPGQRAGEAGGRRGRADDRAHHAVGGQEAGGAELGERDVHAGGTDRVGGELLVAEDELQ